MIAIIIIAANGIGSMVIIVIFALLSAINREGGGKVNRGLDLQQISCKADSPLLNRESNQGVQVSNNSSNNSNSNSNSSNNSNSGSACK